MDGEASKVIDFDSIGGRMKGEDEESMLLCEWEVNRNSLGDPHLKIRGF